MPATDSTPQPTRFPVDLQARAGENLRYIRETMRSAGSFTAVPGWGGVLMGGTALVAAYAASTQPTREGWLKIWLLEAVLAFAIGVVEIVRKSRAAGDALRLGPARRFALSLVPALAAGALLTLVLYRRGSAELLPGVWLLLYGAGVAAGGALSVRVIPLLGLSLMALGAVALLLPSSGNLLMGAGFGGLQILFGAWIARRYGG